MTPMVVKRTRWHNVQYDNPPIGMTIWLYTILGQVILGSFTGSSYVDIGNRLRDVSHWAELIAPRFE